MVPNNVVLGAAVVPVKEPKSVDVRVRLGAGTRPTHVQSIMDGRVTTPTRDAVTVLLEEVDGDDVIVRIQATPEKPADGARLADEVVEALTAVTRVGAHVTGA
jgi:small conductance mechanosensitive channel